MPLKGLVEDNNPVCLIDMDMSRDYKHVRALPEEYTVRLLVDDRELTGKAVVMQDHWYVRQW
jgi:hypothetical protein